MHLPNFVRTPMSTLSARRCEFQVAFNVLKAIVYQQLVPITYTRPVATKPNEIFCSSSFPTYVSTTEHPRSISSFLDPITPTDHHQTSNKTNPRDSKAQSPFYLRTWLPPDHRRAGGPCSRRRHATPARGFVRARTSTSWGCAGRAGPAAASSLSLRALPVRGTGIRGRTPREKSTGKTARASGSSGPLLLFFR